MDSMEETYPTLGSMTMQIGSGMIAIRFGIVSVALRTLNSGGAVEDVRLVFALWRGEPCDDAEDDYEDETDYHGPPASTVSISNCPNGSTHCSESLLGLTRSP